MKLKDICNISENSRNKQILLSLKKKLLKKKGISVTKLMESKIRW